MWLRHHIMCTFPAFFHFNIGYYALNADYKWIFKDKKPVSVFVYCVCHSQIKTAVPEMQIVSANIYRPLSGWSEKQETASSSYEQRNVTLKEGRNEEMFVLHVSSTQTGATSSKFKVFFWSYYTSHAKWSVSVRESFPVVKLSSNFLFNMNFPN